MKLLLDANLSPRVAASLKDHGYEVAHVGDEGLLTAEDHEILTHAAKTGQVIVSADTDFGELLSAGEQHSPSVVLLRSADHLTPEQQAGLLAANLSPSPTTLRLAPSSRWPAGVCVYVRFRSGDHPGELATPPKAMFVRKVWHHEPSVVSVVGCSRC